MKAACKKQQRHVEAATTEAEDHSGEDTKKNERSVTTAQPLHRSCAHAQNTRKMRDDLLGAAGGAHNHVCPCAENEFKSKKMFDAGFLVSF